MIQPTGLAQGFNPSEPSPKAIRPDRPLNAERRTLNAITYRHAFGYEARQKAGKCSAYWQNS